MGCFNSKEEKDDNGSKGPNSTHGSPKKTNFMDEAGCARGSPPPPGIMDSSNSKGKEKSLAYHAGYATKYSSADNNNGSKGHSKKPNLADAAGYVRTSRPCS